MKSNNTEAIKSARFYWSLIIPITLTLLSIAWLIEAYTVGRGFISMYLAPGIIVGNLIGSYRLVWLERQRKRAKP
jgi:hypothetical protein